MRKEKKGLLYAVAILSICILVCSRVVFAVEGETNEVTPTDEVTESAPPEVSSTADANSTAVATKVPAQEVTATPVPTPTPKPVYDGKLTFKKKKLTLQKGKKYQLRVKLSKKNKSGKRITYKSNKPKIVSVNKNGKVKAKKVGKAVITAKLGKAKAKCRITVQDVKTVTVSAAGDCTFGCDQMTNSSIDFNHIYANKGASYFLKNVKSVFGKDDLTIVNLEGTLTDRGSRQDKTFAFRGKPSYVNILTKGSVEAVCFANNHAYDYGQVSYDDTIKYLKEKKIAYSSYSRICVKKVNGIRVGMISVSWPGDIAATLRNAIAKMKKKKHDMLIVSFHCGIERDTIPDATQVALSRIAIDEGGADLVLGHHPHVLQGVEKYHGAYIAYSLGNFCFGGNTNPADKDTMILQQTFKFVNGKLKKDDNMKIIPCCLSSTKSYNNYQPTISKGSEKQRIINKINSYSKTYGVKFDSKGKVKK